MWKAQLLVGVLFMLGHPVFDLPWGLAVPALLDTLFAALLLGLCFVRTQSLALPVGLHMGWNWSLGALGINVSGVDAKGWWAPVQHDGMAWLTGGTYGLEASPVDLVVLFAAILAVWRWRKPAPALALAS